MSPAPTRRRCPGGRARWCWRFPEDMLRDEVEARRPPPRRPAGADAGPDGGRDPVDLLKNACAPVAIVGGGGWDAGGVPPFRRVRRAGRPPRRLRLPPPGRDPEHEPGLCRQSRLRAEPEARPAHQGGRPSPRRRPAPGRGDDRRLHARSRPTIPDQTLVHVHPDPNELNRVYKTCLPICADMREFAELLSTWEDESSPSPPAPKPMRSGSHGPSPAERGELDLGLCVKALREALPGRHHRLQRRRQFLRLVPPLLALRTLPDPARADQRRRWATASRRRRREPAPPGRWCSPLPATAIS